MNKRILAVLLIAAMLLAVCAGCGSQASTTEASATSASVSAETLPEAAADTADDETEPAAEADSAEEPEASAEELGETPEENDFTASNAAMDFAPYKAMLEGLTTELPITED